MVFELSDRSEAQFFANEFKPKIVYSGRPAFTWQKEDLKWIRENMFINFNNDELLNIDGYSYNAYPNNQEFTGKPVKILMFGDQFTWGFGNTDRFSTLGAIVQDKLNAKYGSGVFQIIVNSTHKASTFNFYDYYYTKGISKINPDLVIYNYFNDDINPTFNESLICRGYDKQFCQKAQNTDFFNPSYQDCIHGHYDSFSNLIGKIKMVIPRTSRIVLNNYCEPLYTYAKNNPYIWRDAVQNPTQSLYLQEWARAVGLLKDQFAGRKVGVLRMLPGAPSKDAEAVLMGIFKDKGYEVLPMKNTIKFSDFGGGTIKGKELTKINPGIEHPSAFINNIYSEDIIEYIEKSIPSSQIKSASNSIVKTTRTDSKLVAYSMPYIGVNFSSNKENSALINFDKSLVPNSLQNVQGAPTPYQFSNCVNIGASNFEFILNKDIKNGGITITDLTDSSDVSVGYYTYDKNYIRNLQIVGKYKNGMTLPLPQSSIGTTLVLIFNKYNKGCPVTHEITQPNFSFKLNYRKG